MSDNFVQQKSSRQVARPEDSYAPGAIVRIKLENFVTYDSLEFRPGPNLNVIIGPNGTGKSTVVCAICLGMTGKPIVLGRASNMCDFIKYGKNRGVVEIELKNPNGKNYVVKRVIFKDNKSDWFLNDKPVKLKEIEDLVNDLNIQVGNLCQFLPQEKVTEFARMNSQELLESTEKAVGGLELFENHNQLKDRSKLTKDLERDLRIVEENLSKEEAINSRLENQVKSYNERRKNEENIKWFKRKRACLYYKEKRDEYETIKKDKDRAQRHLQELLNSFDPAEEKKQELDKEIQKLKKVISNKSSQVQEYLRNGKDVTNKLDDLNDKLNEHKQDYLNKENEFKTHKTKLKEIEKSVEMLKAQYDDAKLELTSIRENQKRLVEHDAELRKDHEVVTNKEFEYRQEIARTKSELDEIHKKIMEMKNVREEKLTKLRERAKDIYVAIQWFEKNKQNFRGRVYEPLFLLINIKLRSVTKYVESSIPYRDLTSLFLFENSDDMHYFLTELRDRMNLIVNAALIPNKSLNDFNPPRPLKDIEKYGFQTYLREAIEAPESILVYLCLYASIHQVPVGTDKTQKNLSSILPHISDFSRIYTNTHQYTFSKSRYTSQISSSSVEVTDSYWLASSIDQSKLGDYEMRENQTKLKLKELEAQLAKTLEDKEKINSRITANRAELQKLKEKSNYIDGLGKKMIGKMELLKSLESQNVDLMSEAHKKLQKIADISKLKAKVFKDYIETARNLATLNKEKVLCIYQDAQLQSERLKIENEMREHNERKQELENLVENCQQAAKQARDNAKYALEAASKINEINLEEGLTAEYKQKFATLPDSVHALEAEINQLEAIAQCAYDVDDKIVEDYENRKKMIETLRRDLEKKKDKLTNHQGNYENMKNEWLGKVEAMIQEINVKFSNLFKQLKCAGEVCLSRPDNSEDFSKYGISIKVSFRSDEKLQELTAWQQSGGEKSVSTMLYMIALQEMTKCPFRVVDEINQGMDPVNERKVFDIIVQNSCSKHQAQYFLLTPKLLPDLHFDDKTNIICVFNGPHNIPHSNYNLKNFIELRKKLNENENDNE